MRRQLRSGYEGLPQGWKGAARAAFLRLPTGIQRVLRERIVWGTSAQGHATRAYVRRHGLTVRHGAFAGLRYPGGLVGRADALVAKLLGTYEAELSDVLTEVLADPPRAIVDVGSAEGYYAVGLAVRAPGATVHAFERQAALRRMCVELAAENGVADRVVLRGSCDAGALRELPLERSFLLVDCEGCEQVILDPNVVPGLRGASILVELHEFLVPGVTREVLGRFDATHAVTLVRGEERPGADLRELEELPPGQRAAALDEGRPEQMTWAYLVPRSRAT